MIELTLVAQLWLSLYRCRRGVRNHFVFVCRLRKTNEAINSVFVVETVGEVCATKMVKKGKIERKKKLRVRETCGGTVA